MYLNAILLDFPLAPKVSAELRRQAEEAAEGNPTRAGLRGRGSWSWPGQRGRGSIWEGDLRYETAIVYLRPERHALDAAIDERSRRIATNGLEEAARLRDMVAEGTRISPPVMDSVGVRELYGTSRGRSHWSRPRTHRHPHPAARQAPDALVRQAGANTRGTRQDNRRAERKGPIRICIICMI